MGTVLLVVLLLIFLGALPPVGLHTYGAWPSGLVGVLLLVCLVLALSGRL